MEGLEYPETGIWCPEEPILDSRLIHQPKSPTKWLRQLAVARLVRKKRTYLDASGSGDNFTSFSDDLTELGYDYKGRFINFVGSY